MSKITLATVKSFINKNRPNLLISTKSAFNGMVDGIVVSKDRNYYPVQESTGSLKNTMGIRGAWFVGSSRDGFVKIERTADDGSVYVGYEVYNCCGSFELVIKK